MAKKKRSPLSKLFVSLLLILGVGGVGILEIGEKYADFIPFYQQGRAWFYFTKDRLLKTPDRPILITSYADAENSPYDNLKLGVPAMADVVIDRHGYALGYSERYEQPLWVTYRITAEEVRNKSEKRTDDFRVDPYISTGSAQQEDYRKSGFDRGHLAPAADLAWSPRSMSESFYFSNMSPQTPDFNRGIWRELESKVRDWALAKGELQVVTGPIFVGTPQFIGQNRVAVPQAYYKVLYAPKTKEPAMIGFILPNRDAGDRDLSSFAVSVNRISAATGLYFFSVMDQNLRLKLVNKLNLSEWK
ncbi:MAG: DNA/RNA non-specific endonuclease [Victivallales bacterium]|jgi:endonuclease G|nr:DNA/RNA non-specific endonuclease [Victivallales bacterium]